MSGVMSKLQMLASTLEVKDYAPSIASIAACIAISKIYQIDLPKPFHSATPHKTCKLDASSACCQVIHKLIPGPVSKEALYVYGLLGSLLAEVYVHYYTITTCTKMESFIVEKDTVQFGMNLVKFLLNVPLLSFVTAIKQFLSDELKIRFSERLSNQLHQQFTRNINLCHESANAEEILANGGQRVGNGVVDILVTVAKALIQLIFYFRVLAQMHGTAVPKKFLIFLIVTQAIMAVVRKPLRKLRHDSYELAEKNEKACKNLVKNAEAVAAANGGEQESYKHQGMLSTLGSHMRRVTAATFTSTFTDNILTKYLVLIAGWVTSSRPFVDPENEALADLSEVETMQQYYNTARFMLSIYDSISMLKAAKCKAESLHGETEKINHFIANLTNAEKNFKLLAGSVTFENDVIRMNDVTFGCSEHGNIVENCSLEIKRGQNVFVSGTEYGRAFLKTIAGVCQHKKGQIFRPSKGKVLYITKKPFVFEGTLRDVVIYPHRPIDMLSNGVNDSKLEQILENVQLSHFVGRLNETSNWSAVMTCLELEKLALARVLYHRPQFALLEYCTDELSDDLEASVYTILAQSNVTCLWMSNKESTRKRLPFALHFDDDGHMSFEKSH